MDEVFDEVADDGVKDAQQDEDGHEQVDGVGGQVDGVPGGGHITLKEHRPIFFPVVNLQDRPWCVHFCPQGFQTAVNQTNPPNTSVSSLLQMRQALED